MPGIIELRRYNTAAVAALTATQGELVINTDDWSLHLQDGLTAGGVARLSANAFSGFVNKFRNAALDVDQRGTRAGALTVTTAGAYVTDGMIVLPSGASVTAQQAGAQGATLSSNSLKITGAASVSDVVVRQRIEGTIAAPCSGQLVTVQAKIYNNTGGTITPTLSIGHPASPDTYSAVGSASLVNEVNAASLQACANGVATNVAYTFLASTSVGNGLEINFDCGNNFSTTGKSVQITDLDLRVTPGLAVGLNANPERAELMPIPLALPYCQRYFLAYAALPIGVNLSANWPSAGLIPFPVRMCKVPALAAGASFAIISGSGSAGTPTISTFAGQASVDGCMLENGASSWSASLGTVALTFTGQLISEL